ncbi:HAD family hydrolase [Natronoarchaeum mannanilyticum]|uniref:HAD family hydrolase n=1 Tax=Natronoarchaeum mannanilyticum TaxID=926360 RepID=A0AAV3T8Q5_9EURY
MKAVLFDMDGVLVDSEEYWVALEEEEVLPEAVGEGVVDDEEITGMNYREIHGYLDDHYGEHLDIGREQFETYYEDAADDLYSERVELIEGFEKLADDLRDRGVRTAVVSSSPLDWIGIVVDRFEIGEHFDALVSGDEIEGPSKPEPEVYEIAAAEVGVDPADCVAVEDSENGVEAANRAGMTSVGYRTEINQGMDLSKADHVAEGPEELRGLLLELTS